jgi:curli biogenesis system outer membrane secretion channel CsgG
MRILINSLIILFILFITGCSILTYPIDRANKKLVIDSNVESNFKIYNGSHKLIYEGKTPTRYKFGFGPSYRIEFTKPDYEKTITQVNYGFNGNYFFIDLTGGIITTITSAGAKKESKVPTLITGTGIIVGSTLFNFLTNNFFNNNSVYGNINSYELVFANLKQLETPSNNVRRIVSKMSNEIPENISIAVLDIKSHSGDLRNEILYNFQESRKFTLIDRTYLDTIVKEQLLQWSGEIDTKTASALGQFSGARIIITSKLDDVLIDKSNEIHLTLQALDVETGRIISMMRDSGMYEKSIVSKENIAIKQAVDKLKIDIPHSAKIAVYNISTSNKSLSSDITAEIMFRLFETNKFVIMNRSDIDKIRQEQSLGVSGEFDQRTSAELKRLMGVEAIITGEITTEGNKRFLTVQALDTTTAMVVSIVREEIK